MCLHARQYVFANKQENGIKHSHIMRGITLGLHSVCADTSMS